jgi:hypothetical protein
MSGRQRDPALEREWRERLASWASSGLSVREYCGQRGLVETAFYYWKRELRARNEAAAVTAASRSSALRSSVSRGPISRSTATKLSRPKFVPVTVLSDTVLASATVSVEVRCPSGHVVLLSAYDGVDLASLFAALEPQAPLAREEAQPC